MENKFEIKESIIDGKGAFAIKPIRKGELICCLDGEKISISELKERYEKGKERLSDPLQVSERMYLDLYEPYLYINHACCPNASVVKFNELIAVKNIDSGQEITYDYSLTEWSDEESWRDYEDWFIECKCQSTSCRKKIGEFHSLPKDIQEKSLKQGIVRDFIVKKYKEYYIRRDRKKLLTLCLIHQPPKILLGLKKRGFGAGRWNGFGGKVSEGETIDECVKREVFEEAGIKIKNHEKVGIIEFSFQNNPEILEVHIYRTDEFSGEPAESEEMAPKWFQVDEIPFKKMWPDDKFWLPLLLNGKKFKGKFLFDRPSDAEYAGKIITHGLFEVKEI